MVLMGFLRRSVWVTVALFFVGAAIADGSGEHTEPGFEPPGAVPTPGSESNATGDTLAQGLLDEAVNESVQDETITGPGDGELLPSGTEENATGALEDEGPDSLEAPTDGIALEAGPMKRLEETAAGLEEELLGGSPSHSEAQNENNENEGWQGGDVPETPDDLCVDLAGLCDAAPTEILDAIDPELPGLKIPLEQTGTQDGETAGTNDPAPRKGLVAQQAPGRILADETSAKVLVVVAATMLVAVGAVLGALSSTGHTLGAMFTRWFWLSKGLLLALYARLAKSKVLDHGTRKQIHEFLQVRPGACMSEIRAALQTSESNTRHHLRVLESHGLVVPEKSGRRRCFFVTHDGLSPRARAESAVLSSPAVNRVYRAIRKRPGVRQKELAAALKISRTSVIFHVRRLQEAGVVTQVRRGREAFYYPGSGCNGSDPLSGCRDLGAPA